MKKNFKLQYRKHRSSQEFIFGKMRKTSCLKSFFYSLDDILTGNRIYDFYYKHIYTPIWRLMFHYSSKIKMNISVFFQRGVKDIAKQDVWGLSDYFLKIAYKGIKIFLEDEYGKEPIDWNNRTCETHDKVLYLDLKSYIDCYEKLLKSYENVDLNDNSSEELYKEVTAIYKKIIAKHLEKLWT